MNVKEVEPGPVGSALPARSHRRGMLAGLGVVCLVLAVLLVFGPGGSKPRLAVQGHGRKSPVTIPVRADPTTTVSTTTTAVPPPAPRPTTEPVIEMGAATRSVGVAKSTPTPAATGAPTRTSTSTTVAGSTTTTSAPTTTTRASRSSESSGA